MPKTRKKAKAKRKAKAKVKAKARAKKPGKERELLLRVIDRLGASVASYNDSKTQVSVAHFNNAPFIIDFKTMSVVEIVQPPASGEATVVHPPDAA
jgi:hypothetical protein